MWLTNKVRSLVDALISEPFGAKAGRSLATVPTLAAALTLVALISYPPFLHTVCPILCQVRYRRLSYDTLRIITVENLPSGMACPCQVL